MQDQVKKAKQNWRGAQTRLSEGLLLCNVHPGFAPNCPSKRQETNTRQQNVYIYMYVSHNMYMYVSLSLYTYIYIYLSIHTCVYDALVHIMYLLINTYVLRTHLFIDADHIYIYISLGVWPRHAGEVFWVTRPTRWVAVPWAKGAGSSDGPRTYTSQKASCRNFQETGQTPLPKAQAGIPVAFPSSGAQATSKLAFGSGAYGFRLEGVAQKGLLHLLFTHESRGDPA